MAFYYGSYNIYYTAWADYVNAFVSSIAFLNFESKYQGMVVSSLGTRPSKNRKGGSGTSAGVEVYTAPGMKAHFDWLLISILMCVYWKC